MNNALQNLVDAVETATGQRVHKTTVARWARVGIRGIRLQTWMFGGRRMTSVDAVRLFNEATTAAAANHELTASTTAQRSKAHSEAKRELEKLFAE